MLNDGFTLVCDKCNEETKVNVCDSSISIIVLKNYDSFEIMIECKCGNEYNSED